MKKIINPWKNMEGYNCFGCSPDNEAGVRMEFYEDGDEIVSIWKPRPKYQGWLNTREQKRNIAVIEARLYNSMGELCTEATCTYFTFPQEKAEKEMCFHHCDVEPDEILPLI